jgi:hypothetical protein
MNYKLSLTFRLVNLVVVNGQQHLTGLTFALLVSRQTNVRSRLPARRPQIWNSQPDDIINVSRFRCFVGSLKPICLSFPIRTFISSCSVYGHLIYLIVALQFLLKPL